jgi:hypothetical protein
MNAPLVSRRSHRALCAGALMGLAACGGGGGGGDDGEPPAPAVEAVTLSGLVSDGPVSGGTIFVFAADAVQAALAAVDPGGDRQAALSAADPLAVLQRDVADGAAFSIELPASSAGTPVFLVFDNAGAEDGEFRDTPPNLESVAVLADGGGAQQLNLTTHTTLIAQQVRAGLDPDGDGASLDASAIATATADAEARVLEALGTDGAGRAVFADGASPLDAQDEALVHGASATLGVAVRAAAAAAGATTDAVLTALAADSADGVVDGVIPAAADALEADAGLVEQVSTIVTRGADAGVAALAVGPCTSGAVSQQRRCDVGVLGALLERRASCADIADEAARNACVADAEAASTERDAECAAALDTRLGACTALGDTAYEPAFGAEHATSFVDPAQIGSSVDANPYFPLVSGFTWFYERTFTGDDGAPVTEASTVTVTERTKLVDGVTCVALEDVVTVDEVTVGQHERWMAQDVDGNVWYCGELVRHFATFEGDDPATPELVDVAGSWKSARDGAEPGIAFPAQPEVGAVFRAKAAWGAAEVVVEVLDLDGSESAGAGFCEGTCVVTRETMASDPETTVTKHYISGLGLLVAETDDERVELAQFSPLPP